jgi:putative oxidoreductase
MAKRWLLTSDALSLGLGLLVLRVINGACLIFGHGWGKLTGFSERMNSFGDPYGLGSAPSLTLAVFAEVFCSALLILGLFTRLALIPLIIMMITIVFIVHGADPFGKKELPLLYLASFTTLFFTGPGKYSVDSMRGK